MNGRLRGIATAAVAVTIAAALSACAPVQTDDQTFVADARALTTTEAQTLAAVRLRNATAGTRSISFTVTDRGASSDVSGWFDYTTAVGYALAQNASARELLLWNGEVLGSHPTAADTVPLPIPDVGDLANAWQGGALDPSGSRLHNVLAVIASLGADRPDNPLLLQQSGALWLGERTVDGTDVTVFAGPPSDQALPTGQTPDPAAAVVRYWVDATATLLRLDIRVGGSGDWTTVRFGPGDGVTLGNPFSAAGASG